MKFTLRYSIFPHRYELMMTQFIIVILIEHIKYHINQLLIKLRPCTRSHSPLEILLCQRLLCYRVHPDGYLRGREFWQSAKLVCCHVIWCVVTWLVVLSRDFCTVKWLAKARLFITWLLIFFHVIICHMTSWSSHVIDGSSFYHRATLFVITSALN